MKEKLQSHALIYRAFNEVYTEDEVLMTFGVKMWKYKEKLVSKIFSDKVLSLNYFLIKVDSGGGQLNKWTLI